MFSSGKASDEKKQLDSSDVSDSSQKKLSGLIAKAHIPGISLATISHGKISESSGIGLSDVEAKTPVTADTIFWACSLSKPVFAYLVIKLIKEEKLGKDFTLDTPLWTIFDWTDYFKHDDRRKLITARMVLSHQTGMPNEGELDKHFNPGQLYRYSGQGYIYLQKTIEKITGLSLEELAQNEIFLPLGMNHTSFLLPEPEYIATTHNEIMHPRLPLPLLMGNNNHPAASLHTTAHDYALFLEACLGNIDFIEIALKTSQVSMVKDKEALDKKLDPTTLQSIHWGLGFGLQKSTQEDGSDIVFHWRDGPGAKNFFAMNLNTHSAVVYLTNSENGMAIAKDVVTPIIGDIEPTLNYLFNKYNFKNYLEVEEAYQKMIIDSSNMSKQNNRLKWLGELKKYKENPLSIEKDILQKYIGIYGPFNVSWNGNFLQMVLFGCIEHTLIPLSKNLFGSKNDLTLRLEFNGEQNHIICHSLNPAFAFENNVFHRYPNLFKNKKDDVESNIISIEFKNNPILFKSMAGKFALKLSEEKLVYLQLIVRENKLFLSFPYPSPDDPYKQFEVTPQKLEAEFKTRLFSPQADFEIYFPEGNTNLIQFGSIEAKRVKLTSTAQFTVSTSNSTESLISEKGDPLREVKGHSMEDKRINVASAMLEQEKEKIISPGSVQRESTALPTTTNEITPTSKNLKRS